MTIFLYIIIAIVIAFFIYIVSIYNKLSTRRNKIHNSISSLDALFNQRAEFVPSLIAIVKQCVVFENDTLEKIAELRKPACPTSSENSYLQAEEGSTTLKQIVLQVENYPELKSSEQFIKLKYAFNECETQIFNERRDLSTSITDYNDCIVLFPSNIIAAFFCFKKYTWQYATEAQRLAPNANNL